MPTLATLCFHSGNPKDCLVLPEVLERLQAARFVILPAITLAQKLREQRLHELPEKV